MSCVQEDLVTTWPGLSPWNAVIPWLKKVAQFLKMFNLKKKPISHLILVSV